MIHDELVDYISHELAHGSAELEIKKALIASGWSEAEIGENFSAARQRHAVTPIFHEQEPKQKREFLRKHAKAIVALVFALLFLAGGVFAAYKLIPPPPEKMLTIAALNMQEVKSLDFSGRITADVTTPDSIFNLQAFLPQEVLDQISDRRVAGAATSLDFALDFKGTFDSNDPQHPKGEIDMDVSSGIFTIGMKMKFLDEILYFKLDQIPPITEEINKYRDIWIKVDPAAISKQYGLGVSLEGIQPDLTEGQKKQIEELTKQVHFYNSVTKLGNDQIDGESVYHYSVALDKAGIKNYLQQVEKINRTAGGVSDTSIEVFDSLMFKDVEVWIGKSDRMIRRYSMNISQAPSSDSIPTGSMNLLMNFSNFNNTGSVEAPAIYKNIEDVIKDVMDQSLSNAQVKSRDARRIADVRMILTALELYYNDYNRYPNSLKNLSPKYFAVIPVAPVPVDGSCTVENNTYTYSPKNSGKAFSLAFCLGGVAGIYGPGTHTASASGIE